MALQRALIVDDDQNSIIVIQLLLEEQGIACEMLNTTKNIEDALRHFQDIDVVFLDLEMPNTNGFDTLKVIRAYENFRETLVIVHSAHMNDIEIMLRMGFDGFIGKPLNAEMFPELLQRIARGEQVVFVP